MSSDKQDWLEENGIPIKPSNDRYQGFLGKLYNLIGLHSAPGVQRIETSPSGVTKLYFFKLQAIVLTKEIFLTRLQEHLLMLKTDYIRSHNNYSAICDNLTQLITAQIEQQLTIDQSPVCSFILP
jgi:hypothetical protein